MRIFFLAMMMALTGCATSLSGDVYSRDEARRTQQVEYGRIDEVRPVIIEGTQTGAGSAAGAAIGAIAGSGVSSGDRESRIGAVLIGAAGAVVGNKAEEALTQAQGLEMILTLDSGRVLSVVQEVASVDEFLPGQRIKLIGSGKNSRVSPAAP
ncbi:MAG: glycine zipper 2TM domain-containing protein [Litorivicinus sp.]